MKSSEDLKFLQVALHLGLLGSGEARDLISQSARGSGGKFLSPREELLQRGRLSPPQIQTILYLMDQGYLFCPSCYLTYSLRKESSSPQYFCSTCKGPLQIHQGGTESPLSSEGDLPLLEPQPLPSSSVQCLLGEGGGGRVLEVFDPLSRRPMALKVLRSEKKSSPGLKSRFLREIQITSMLEHPNIMPVYDSGYLKDGTPYYMMKEIKGGTLKDFIQARPGTWREGVEIFLKVCDGMAYAHSKAILHRDLKPSNIAVGDFGEVIVMDWGLAKRVGEELDVTDRYSTEGEEDITLSGALVGTPGYMAPEQARGEELDQRADVYSLGAILYEILTGSPPFGGSIQERLVSVLSRDPLPPHEREKGRIPRELSAISLKGLCRSREDRYQSVSDLKKDLVRFLEGASVEAHRYLVWERGWKWVKKNKGLAFSVLAFLLVMVGGVLFLHWREGQDRKKNLAQTLDRVEKILSGTLRARDLLKQYDRQRIFREESLRKKRMASLRSYLQARDLLEKALEVEENHRELREGLFQVEREIGNLALLGRDYMLSQLAFERCLSLGKKEEGALLLQGLEKEKRAVVERDLKHLKEMIRELEKGPPQEGMMDEYITEILRMQGDHRFGILLEALENSHKWPRLLAIEALGKLGNRDYRWKAQTVGEGLVKKLEKINLKKDMDEGESLIWALGRLREGKANQVVHLLRARMDQSSSLWERTALPYSWIPGVSSSSSGGSEDAKLVARGTARAEKNDLKGAMRDFNRAIELNPRYSTAWKGRGFLYLRMNQNQKAARDLEKYLELNPRDPRAEVIRKIVERYKGN